MLGLLVLSLVAAAGCVRAPVQEAARPAAFELSELWIDAFAVGPGDGGVDAALREVPPLEAPAVLHLRSGLYPGPFQFPAGTRVEGHGAAVLYVEGPGAVVTATGPLTLEGVSVQGGAVGVLARAPVTLRRVKFSGHRAAAIQAFDGGVTGVQLEVSSRLDGVGVEAINAEVGLDGVTLLGPLSYGVRAADSRVLVSGLRSEGPATALQVVRGAVEADDVRAAGGRNAAVLVSKTRGSVKGLDVTGHEYALLGTGNELAVRGVMSRGAAVGGVSLLDSTVTMTDLQVERAGAMGGVQLLGCTSTVAAVSVVDSRGCGVLVRKGRATLGVLTVQGIAGERGLDGTLASGDALQVRDAEVDLVQLDARDLDGAGIYVSNYGAVRAGAVLVERSGFGAVVVERKSSVTADRVVSRGSRGPSVAAPDDGLLVVKSLTAQGGDVAVWADCDSGSRVTVQSVAEGTTLPALRCLWGPKRSP